MLNENSIKNRFSLIYKNNLWESKESRSGKGSELVYTLNLRNWLVEAIPKYTINTIVDAPCGDFNWMHFVTSKCNFNYIGLDIVDHVIENNKIKYESKSVQFKIANICTDQLPQCDLLIVRDCLFHLSFNDIDSFLRNISRVDYKYLLTTTHLVNNKFTNSDIVSGDFRIISLFHSPFCFKYDCVIESIQDNPDNDPTPRQMILIAKEDVPTSLLKI